MANDTQDKASQCQSDVTSEAPVETIKVDVVYASQDRQLRRELVVDQSTTVLAAVRKSGLLNDFPELEVDTLKLGIYGKVVPADTQLQNNDRVEIYRQLKIDAKQARRQRAKKH
jgi:putative ubiquitin-RnfH superfamily antitoxin RatB of RatAB toxin-antitoxin module|tara:strand:+ start:1454 stop:1795 length:342 start_codon:yes stop_codon:yes gene_type:complete